LDDAHLKRIEANPDFIELIRSRRTFGWTLTAIMLVIYYGYIALVAYDKPLIAQPLFGAVTVGLVVGIGVIISAVVLTGIYVLRANGKFDELSRRIIERNNAGAVRFDGPVRQPVGAALGEVR
jgi:uncharacterized membrane protein (DUF485 family)